MKTLQLAFMQTLRLWRSGALSVLVFSLVIAVTAIAAVGFFTQRVDSALSQQGGLLLGGDLAVVSDHAIRAEFITQAAAFKLRTVKTYEFPSMVMAGEQGQLAEIKAVDPAFPLRGDLTVGESTEGPGRIVQQAPQIGEVWIEPRLANLLNLTPGDTVTVGDQAFKIDALLLREPSRGGDMFSFAPRVMLNAVDLPATNLIQFGSRVKYQLLLSGDPQNIAAYAAVMQSQLMRGERIEALRNARPEIKLALDKAEQFLGLSAMVSVVLAMAAMLLSAMPYIRESLDTFALMRCFGASQKMIMRLLTYQTLLIALMSGAIGVIIAYFAQELLAGVAGSLFVETLPPVSWAPVWVGLIAGIAMMLAVVLPHAWQMRHMTAMNILRRDTFVMPISAYLRYLPAALVMAGMVFWQARDTRIACATIVAMIALSAMVALSGYLLAISAQTVMNRLPRHWLAAAIALGIQGFKTRLGLSTLQMIGFSMGLSVLMLLTLIRTDLLQNWQASLPENAPNRFVINIQPAQIPGIQAFFHEQNIHDASVLPMVKGRLTAINGQPVNASSWQGERARRLAEREFNLSWAATMQSDNQLVAGRWWREDEHGQPYLSLEQDLAQTLGIQLGDQLMFHVAGQPLELSVVSIRKVDWDTMRANFFAVTPPGILTQYPASYISSFHLPVGADQQLNQLIKAYPNLTVIDVAALMQQVRGIMQKMSAAIEYVFIFSLIAGMAVLYAALVATREERVREATLMRVFGASRRQAASAFLTEFLLIGTAAALIATLSANALAYYVSHHVLDIGFDWNISLALTATLCAMFTVPAAAWLGLRSYLNIPPRQLLNSI